MRDVNYGWLLRYLHANGASMFFIVVYIHTFRGLYYSSYLYPKQHLWSVGVIILLVMILLHLWAMFCHGVKCLFGEPLL